MFGEKPAENSESRIVHDEWRWTDLTYIVEFKHPLNKLVRNKPRANRGLKTIKSKPRKMPIKE